ncbi:MAG: Altronate dehydratase [Thermotoga sp. 50_1627]|uniref:UxaA family hydrolase n=1 Tax=Pseudothermotoga sp. TaxID=2033661 RepID=UPI00076DBC9E|nr:MAG: Altronate dehydratase [Thermotoga sp. 50_64]KUK24728.1 MAG: Altronate dehydratase [Thermotoga sp. 50_1627]MBC7116508.1 UxaA family hydrolase [Pseudothermotoga sp.]MDK2923799.1 (2R)-sulfolactate sulfo-lyase subunit beta [Pseudothermotoga sp.]HBT40365.1 D-galactarate dehydratase [Pseudothermotoga sp.]
MERQILAYRRENGKVGIRNYVLLITIDDISNAVVEAVEKAVAGTLAIPHPYGRLQFGKDLELLFRTLIGTGSNPNVAAAIVVGIEPKWTTIVAEGIAKANKPVEAFWVEGSGQIKTIERVMRTAVKMVEDATNLRREPVDISELLISLKCGESDTTSGLGANKVVGRFTERFLSIGGTVLFGETTELTGAEHIVASRFKDEREREKFLKFFEEYQQLVKSQGVDLLGSQPTEGNIAGGLSTIEEKALGNIQKIGNAMIDGALDYAEPPKGKGLYFMNTSSAAAEAVTLFAAAGAVIHLFPTGQGNPIGNPILPVVKITANPKTAANMSEHIDVDVSAVLRGEMNLDQAADMLWKRVVETANGRMVKAEILNHKEFVLTKLYPSA